MVALVLDEITSWKREELAERKSRRPQAVVEAAAKDAPSVRDFRAAIHCQSAVKLIAEVKKASPSAGLIRPDFNPVDIAREYERNGAAAVSVLTDEKYFQGSFDYLRDIRRAARVPALCKEFIIDAYQIHQARAAGADAILLIVRILSDDELVSFLDTAHALGMAVLVETHGEEEVERALSCGARIIGINNRDLDKLTTDVETTFRLAPLVPGDCVMVSESGIRTREDVIRLQDAGVHAILVGESLMRSDDIGRKVRSLLGT